VDEALRQRMGQAAVAAARAVGYQNAGTVEFIVAPDGSFHFMEMNTRLQVEHPVTELVTGLDLVEWQLRVAAGEPLPAAQDDLRQSGHAFEVRIYAEDPDNDFLPATGRIRRFIHPLGDGVRVDTGVGDGDLIGPDYDPMIAKLCVHAEDRADAVMALRAALSQTLVSGLTTNLPLLRAVAAHHDFAAGALDTGWIERELDALKAWPGAPTGAAIIAAAEAVAARWSAETRALRPHDAGSPWTEAVVPEQVRFGVEDSRPEGRSHEGRSNESAAVVTAMDGDALVVTDDDGRCWEIDYRSPFAPQAGATDDEAHPGAPMPGRIVAIHCKPGQQVSPGDPLLVLEAMKMEYTLQARAAGTIERVLYGVGDMVDAEVPLVDIHTEDA
jgi:3-methylcrotonyl-CoA carboxylase alpha subunit